MTTTTVVATFYRNILGIFIGGSSGFLFLNKTDALQSITCPNNHPSHATTHLSRIFANSHDVNRRVPPCKSMDERSPSKRRLSEDFACAGGPGTTVQDRIDVESTCFEEVSQFQTNYLGLI